MNPEKNYIDIILEQKTYNKVGSYKVISYIQV